MGVLSPIDVSPGNDLSVALEKSRQVVHLRNLLTQQFPHVRHGLALPKAAEILPTGIESLDRLLNGGLARAAFTELVARGYGSGSVEVIHVLLRSTAIAHQFLALVDGAGSFDPGAAHPRDLARLLWIRCNQTMDAFKAMDLLLRDRNFPLVVLDLKLNPARELRKISSSIWFRYARLVEQNRSTVLVITPHPLVSVATCRILLESNFGIDALSYSRSEIEACLRFKNLRPLPFEEPLAKAS